MSSGSASKLKRNSFIDFSALDKLGTCWEKCSAPMSLEFIFKLKGMFAVFTVVFRHWVPFIFLKMQLYTTRGCKDSEAFVALFVLFLHILKVLFHHPLSWKNNSELVQSKGGLNSFLPLAQQKPTFLEDLQRKERNEKWSHWVWSPTCHWCNPHKKSKPTFHRHSLTEMSTTCRLRSRPRWLHCSGCDKRRQHWEGFPLLVLGGHSDS